MQIADHPSLEIGIVAIAVGSASSSIADGLKVAYLGNYPSHSSANGGIWVESVVRLVKSFEHCF
jgi:hypothetical protein